MNRKLFALALALIAAPLSAAAAPPTIIEDPCHAIVLSPISALDGQIHAVLKTFDPAPSRAQRGKIVAAIRTRYPQLLADCLAEPAGSDNALPAELFFAAADRAVELVMEADSATDAESAPARKTKPRSLRAR